jgi:DnaK suppressor protein
MDRATLEHFEELLIMKREEEIEQLMDLEKRFSETQKDSSNDLSSYPLHIADLATDTETKETESMLISSYGNMLADIDRALKKVYSGEYGKCENCGEEISEKRLEAIPWAKLCIQCKREEEARGL